jgi:hypothetical protein
MVKCSGACRLLGFQELVDCHTGPPKLDVTSIVCGCVRTQVTEDFRGGGVWRSTVPKFEGKGGERGWTFSLALSDRQVMSASAGWCAAPSRARPSGQRCNQQQILRIM